MMPRPIRGNSRLRELLPTHISKLCGMLDPLNLWKDLAAHITNRNEDFMFDTDQVINIESRTSRTGESPTKHIITSWYTDNPTINNLRSVLLQIQAYRAVKYIDLTVLKLETSDIPECKANQAAELPLPPDDIPESAENFNHSKISDRRVGMDIPEQICGSMDTTRIKRRLNDTSTLTCGVSDEYSEGATKAVRGIFDCEQFSYEFLETITDNFNKKSLSSGGRLIGEGAFGFVFKGIHPEYPGMAVKRFYVTYLDIHSDPVACRQYTTEIDILSRCRHENLLPLLGYSDLRELCVVYEYMSNGSLEDRLARKGGTPSLSVMQRLKIVKSVARGLNYLHSQDPQLIHRDIKSANILLDADFIAKIGDFGTVRLGPEGSKTSTYTMSIIGTMPYMPIEYITENQVSEKMDAYSYGVVLLEILTGLPVYDTERDDKSLPPHVQESIADGITIVGLLDQSAGEWGETLPHTIYAASERFLEYKGRRPTIQNALPEIEGWEVS